MALAGRSRLMETHNAGLESGRFITMNNTPANSGVSCTDTGCHPVGVLTGSPDGFSQLCAVPSVSQPLLLALTQALFGGFMMRHKRTVLLSNRSA